MLNRSFLVKKSGATWKCKVSVVTRHKKLNFVSRVYIQDRGISLQIQPLNVSGNETQWIGFCAITRTSISQIKILKYGFGFL